VRAKTLLRSFGAVLLCVSPAAAGDSGVAQAGCPGCPAPSPPPCNAPWLPSTTPGTQVPGQQQPDAAAQPPGTDAFAQAPPTGGEAASTALPNMIGDLGFYGVAPRIAQSSLSTGSSALTVAQLNQRYALSPTYPSPGYTGLYFDINNSQTFTAAQLSALLRAGTITQSSVSSRVPVVNFGSFKISDNESVQPVDRVFLTYNYFDADGFHGDSSGINREVIGFEKTFFDGAASFGIRAPFTQVGEGLGGSSEFDSLSLVFKYAFYQDRESGNVFSGGLVVTVPTGPSIPIDVGSTINPTLLQPYLGYVFNFGRLYVQGFAEIIVPTDSTLSTFISNDIGIGYRLEAIPVTPTIEIHSNDALNHQGSDASPLGFVDSVVVTGGLHTRVGNSILTLGVATPITGPRLDSVEAVVQLNWRF
jgi:hypothetical protein